MVIVKSFFKYMLNIKKIMPKNLVNAQMKGTQDQGRWSQKKRDDRDGNPVSDKSLTTGAWPRGWAGARMRT